MTSMRSCSRPRLPSRGLSKGLRRRTRTCLWKNSRHCFRKWNPTSVPPTVICARSSCSSKRGSCRLENWQVRARARFSLQGARPSGDQHVLMGQRFWYRLRGVATAFACASRSAGTRHEIGCFSGETGRYPGGTSRNARESFLD